jgi:hypothetical protein
VIVDGGERTSKLTCGLYEDSRSNVGRGHQFDGTGVGFGFMPVTIPDSLLPGCGECDA